MSDIKNVRIVGVGALGSHVLQFLRNENVMISLIDFDRVEQKNTVSQFHSKKGVGKMKVAAALDVVNFLWGSKLDILGYKLTKDNTDALLTTKQSTLIIDCLDNADGRRLLQDHVRLHRLSCIHGALAADGAFGQVIWDKDFQIDDEADVGVATCEGGDHLPFIATVASMLAYAVQRFLREGKHIGFAISPGGVQRI
jgi:molybdopterin/thiamine biosynthesis adenylyltransferase